MGKSRAAPVDVYKTCWYSSPPFVGVRFRSPLRCVRQEACWIFEFSLIYYVLQSVAKEKDSVLVWLAFNQSAFRAVVVAAPLFLLAFNSHTGGEPKNFTSTDDLIEWLKNNSTHATWPTVHWCLFCYLQDEIIDLSESLEFRLIFY